MYYDRFKDINNEVKIRTLVKYWSNDSVIKQEQLNLHDIKEVHSILKNDAPSITVTFLPNKEEGQLPRELNLIIHGEWNGQHETIRLMYDNGVTIESLPITTTAARYLVENFEKE